jgi:hypothetical protein
VPTRKEVVGGAAEVERGREAKEDEGGMRGKGGLFYIQDVHVVGGRIIGNDMMVLL